MEPRNPVLTDPPKEQRKHRRKQHPEQTPTDPAPREVEQNPREPVKPQHMGTGGPTQHVDPAQAKRDRITLPNGEILYIKKSTRKQQNHPRKKKHRTEDKEKKTEQNKFPCGKRKREQCTEEQNMNKKKGTKYENTKSDTHKPRHTNTHRRRLKPKLGEKPYRESIEKFLVRTPRPGPSVAAEIGPKPSGEDATRGDIISNSNLDSFSNSVKSKSGAIPTGIEGGESLKAPMLSQEPLSYSVPLSTRT